MFLLFIVVTNQDGTKNITKMAIFGMTGLACASFASYKLYKWLGRTSIPVSDNVGDNDNAQSSGDEAPKSNGLTTQANEESTTVSRKFSQYRIKSPFQSSWKYIYITATLAN